MRRLLALLSSFILAFSLFVALGEILGQAEVSLTRITYASDTSRRSELPSIGCDGARIAFVSNSDFHSEGLGFNKYIWLYDAKTTALTRLTPRINSLDYSDEPSISADGTKIAFHSDNDFLGQGIVDGQHEIWLATANSLTLTRLTSTTYSFGVSNYQASISADGTRVAFSGNFDFLNTLRLNHFEIWLVDTATRQVIRVTTAIPENRASIEPRLSADGTRVVFRSSADFFNEGIPGNIFHVWLYDTVAMTLTRVSNLPYPPIAGQNYVDQSISADGARIVFTGNGDLLNQGLARIKLWLYDTTTMTFTQVTSSPYHILQPEISPDGSTIFFSSGVDPVSGQLLSARELWQYDIAGMTFRRVTSSTVPGVNEYPSPNSDGTIVAFQSNVDFYGEGNVGVNEIWRADITPTLVISPPTPLTRTVYLPVVMRGLGASIPVVWEDDDFDSLTPGELDGQSGWFRAAPDRASAIVAPSAGGGNLLHIDAGPGETIVMGKDVPDQANGQHTLTARVLVEANPNYFGCAFADGAFLDSLAKIEVRTNPNGGWDKKFQLYFGSRTMRINYGPTQRDAVPILTRTQLGHWYTIQVNFDLNTELAQVWVDGVLAARDVPIHPGPVTDLGLSGWDLPGYVQLDDLHGTGN